MRAIVGTAGHIDHGKSALVQALTGIDTDRLPEEKARGISIELGFAHLDLDGIGRVGIVDVPGHERFIRQMLAGAHGFDLVLVVVAADDGVMPQTEEHFDIVHLLGVPRAIFVVTKVDAVSAARVAEVREEIEILAVGTRFEEAPVVAVSARSGEGIEALRESILQQLADLRPRPDVASLRLPVDRVFVLHGHGVVVTGTALEGRVSPGDEVQVLPSGRRARVREVQVHGEGVSSASAGQRVALNLSGLGRDEIVRGDTVAGPGPHRVVSRLDARVEVRPAASRPLASHIRVRVHHGTREARARLVWADGIKEVEPRHSEFAQLVLAEPLVVRAGDRFILRDETARRTIGGGVVLLAIAERRRGSHAHRLALLEDPDPRVRLRAVLQLVKAPALEVHEAAEAVGLAAEEFADRIAGAQDVVLLPKDGPPLFVLDAARAETFRQAIDTGVEAFQKGHPDLAGVDLEHLRGGSGGALDPRLFRLLVESLLADGRLQRRGNLVHTPGHAPSLGPDDALAARLLDRLRAAATMPPTVKELSAEMRVDAARVTRALTVLAGRGELVKVSAELFFAKAAVDAVVEALVARLQREGEITAAGFRDLIAGSRKYGIPLLDWLDRSGLTIRVGDVRKLRRT